MYGYTPPCGGMGTRLKQMFEICDTYMIVFLCERTLRRIPYGKSEGLKFSALKEPLAKAAKAVDSFWEFWALLWRVRAKLPQRA